MGSPFFPWPDIHLVRRQRSRLDQLARLLHQFHVEAQGLQLADQHVERFGDARLGRAKTYESIVNSEEITAPHLPESFKVLLSEIKGLGLSVDLIER